MTRPVVLLTSSLGLAALLVLAARADDPPAEPTESKAEPVFSLDIGRFSQFAPGISVDIAKDENGRATVQVDVEKPAAGGTGVKVDVGRGADGKPAVSVDVQRDGANDINVNVGDGSVAAPKPASTAATETFLGVFTRPIPEELHVQLSSLIGKDRGLLVLGVQPGSPAEKADLKRHDILVQYDDHNVTSVEQLRKLIAADKAGRTVKLTVIRAGESKMIDAVLGQRQVTQRAAIDAETQNAQADRNANIVIRREGSNVIISKRLIQVPGVTIRLGGKGDSADTSEPAAQEPADSGEAKGVKQDANRKLLVTSLDGKHFKVELEYVAADGAKIERVLEGTPAEIEEKANELPKEIGDDVRRSIEDFGDEGEKKEGDKKQSRAFRFQIEPLVEGDLRLLRLSMRREGNAGETRLLKVQQQYDPAEPIEVADLMKIDVVASELQELGPVVREKVEATLNRVQIPQVRVDVEKSQ